MIEDFIIWEGVHDSFDQVPTAGDGFESDTWINRSLFKIKEAIKLSKNNEINAFDNALYSISSVLYSMNQKIKILDFGGGMGNSFVPLCSMLPSAKYVDFTVVEGERNVISASTLFANDERIKFVTKLPSDNNYDIINISSSLQYIDKWQSLLEELSKYKAKYFIFTDMPAGDIEKTYVSSQKHYESKIAHIFFKLDDVIDTMNQFGYKLIYKNNFESNVLRTHKHYPQDNFEDKYKINYSKTLVFQK